MYLSPALNLSTSTPPSRRTHTSLPVRVEKGDEDGGLPEDPYLPDGEEVPLSLPERTKGGDEVVGELAVQSRSGPMERGRWGGRGEEEKTECGRGGREG